MDVAASKKNIRFSISSLIFSQERGKIKMADMLSQAVSGQYVDELAMLLFSKSQEGDFLIILKNSSLA